MIDWFLNTHLWMEQFYPVPSPSLYQNRVKLSILIDKTKSYKISEAATRGVLCKKILGLQLY